MVFLDQGSITIIIIDEVEALIAFSDTTLCRFGIDSCR